MPWTALGTGAQAGQGQQEQHEKGVLFSEHAGVMGSPFFPCSWSSIPGRSRAPHGAAPQQLLPQSCSVLGDSPHPGANHTGLARALGTWCVCPGLPISHGRAQHQSEKCHCGFQTI